MVFGKKRPAKQKLGFERLDERVVLSANAAGLGGEGEAGEAIVVREGDVAFVFGTEDDNLINVVMGETSHVVTIDGVDHEFDAVETRHIVISGQGGNDEANVEGTAADDRVKIDDEEVEMLSADYGVRIRNAEVIRLFGNQGFDTARIRDSSGDDQIFMHSTFTGYVNSSGDNMEVNGFERVDAFAERGGNDQVSFYDSPENDRFVAKETFSYLVGTGFSNYAEGFERVDAYYRNGGADEARLFGSNNDDALHSTPTQVVFQVGNTTQVTHDFPATRAFGMEGNDTAEMYGLDGVRDSFGWKPGFAFMTTIGTDALIAANSAEGFESVQGFGHDEMDRAKLTGSPEDDTYIALPEITQLTTPNDGTVTANTFGMVSAFGGGGQDFAHLEDSSENDRYTGRATYAFFKGPGFVNYVSGFSKIDAVSKNGGGDFGHAFDYRGPDRDYLIHDGLQFLVFGPDRSERFIEFEKARGDAADAGFQIVTPIINDFVLGGTHDNSPTGRPNPDATDQIVARLAEAVGEFEVFDGRIT